jgi:phosphoribosylglycinamide formyltransferase-1
MAKSKSSFLATCNMSKKIVVLISGSGSNLQAIMDAIDAKRINGSIACVISNKADAYGLVRAAHAGIETQTLNHKEFESREAFDDALQQTVDQYAPDIVVLAGFMRILTPRFVQHYHGRMLNIHPSLLPKYKGLHTHKRALEAGDTEHGCTVHLVTEELDGGPLLVQASVPILEGDTEDTLQQRVHQQEHIAYPLAVELMCEDRITLTETGILYDGEPLQSSGIQVAYSA